VARDTRRESRRGRYGRARAGIAIEDSLTPNEERGLRREEINSVTSSALGSSLLGAPSSFSLSRSFSFSPAPW
jgi:hypothetical protein